MNLVLPSTQGLEGDFNSGPNSCSESHNDTDSYSYGYFMDSSRSMNSNDGSEVDMDHVRGKDRRRTSKIVNGALARRSQRSDSQGDTPRKSQSQQSLESLQSQQSEQSQQTLPSMPQLKSPSPSPTQLSHQSLPSMPHNKIPSQTRSTHSSKGNLVATLLQESSKVITSLFDFSRKDKDVGSECTQTQTLTQQSPQPQPQRQPQLQPLPQQQPQQSSPSQSLPRDQADDGLVHNFSDHSPYSPAPDPQRDRSLTF